MKKLLLALLMVAGITVAQAQVVGNVGATSDYRFRGISQTQNGPAVQAGVDYTHSSGFYVGNWNSSVSGALYTNGAGIESDVYAGFKKDVAKGITLDVGTMNYFYPGYSNSKNKNGVNEVYAALSYGPVTVKYSQAISNYFGLANSKNTSYYQADVAQVIPGTKVVALAHVGRTDVSNYSKLSYTDYNVGVGYKLAGWDLAVKYYMNDDTSSTFKTANTASGEKLYKDAVVFSVAHAF
jgi:uncharacterized protein (TIGR02001 family)